MTGEPSAQMRVSEGTCSHCSAHVVWDEEQGHYVSVSPGAPDLLFCGAVEDENNYHNVASE